MSLFLLVFLMFTSMDLKANEFPVPAERFSAILDNSLAYFRMKTEKLAGLKDFRKFETFVQFGFPESGAPGDCARDTQRLDVETKAFDQTIKQSFIFTNCVLNREAVTLTRTGIGIKPISIDSFLRGSWGLPETEGTWTLDISWNGLKIVAERKANTQKTQILLDFSEPMSSGESYYFEWKIIESTLSDDHSETTKFEYFAKFGHNGHFSNYSAIKNRQHQETFWNYWYELAGKEIMPSQFNSFYQGNVTQNLGSLLSFILGSIPFR